jgi:hypothetical protein
LRAGKGQHHRHLQENTEKITDIVSAVFGETLRAIPALKQKGLAVRHRGELFFQLARLACKNQRRIGRQLLLGFDQTGGVRIGRNLADRFFAPGIRRPFVRHSSTHSSRRTHGP